jgi:hypothetical protein
VTKYILIIGAGAWFIHALMKKPDRIAILLFTTIIADINFDMPGVPLNFRAFLSLVLLGKIIADSKPLPGPSFMSTTYSKYVIGFSLYVLAITYYNDLGSIALVKEYLLILLYAYLGYYYYMKDGSYKIFKTSIILAGFSCVGDLAWTYMQGGGLWIQRIYFSFVPAFEVCNHNFFGYICGIAFVFLLSDYLTDNGNHKWNLLCMPVMFLGVLLSTSRSSLLMLIIISVVLITKGALSRKNSKKAYKLVVVTISCLILSLFLFQILSSVFHIQSEFVEQITGRLIDEPVAIFNRFMGNDFKAESLDSMDWRAEATEIAYKAFTDLLTTSEQVMGIGNDGFMERHYGYMGIYAAHNGILLMLIEFGVIGFVIYYCLLGSLIIQSIRLKYFSPFIVCLVFIFLFMISHNREMTSHFVFLMTGTLAAELTYITHGVKQEVEEEDDTEMITATANN